MGCTMAGDLMHYGPPVRYPGPHAPVASRKADLDYNSGPNLWLPTLSPLAISSAPHHHPAPASAATEMHSADAGVDVMLSKPGGGRGGTLNLAA